jgi:hypothetical protein
VVGGERMAIGNGPLLLSLEAGTARAAALRCRINLLSVLLGLSAGVGGSTASDEFEFTLDSEVEEGLESMDDTGRTSGQPGGGVVVTRRMLGCAFGDGVGAGFSDFGDEGDENFSEGMLERELEKSASGTARGCLGMRREVPSVEARGRTPISVRGSITSCSGMEWGIDSFLEPVTTSSSDSCRPFPLSTLLDLRDLVQRSLKLKCESLRFRPEFRVLCLRSLSDISTSASAS